MDEEDSVLDFNFWPSFSDLMLSLVLILILVLFLVAAVITGGTVDLSHVERNQASMINTIAEIYRVKPQPIDRDTYGISIQGNGVYDILIKNEPMLQKLAFSNHILFPPDRCELSERGQTLLRNVGETLRNQLSIIREIQIQGHADPVPSRIYSSNLELAANRAMNVYKFFQINIGIDPASHLMSATSFGEFKPVQRSEEDMEFSRAKLDLSNATDELMTRNRRIELLLFYKFRR